MQSLHRIADPAMRDPLTVDGPVTIRPQLMSVATRIEVVSNVVAGVLHNAYTTQMGRDPSQLAHAPSAVQRVYEGMARLAVVPLLDEQALARAERKAIDGAADMLLRYLDDDNDEPPSRCITPELWERRITAMVRSALAVYQAELMRVAR